MPIDIHPKKALLNAAICSDKPVAFLVGSPLSIDSSGGVAGIDDMLGFVREEVYATLPNAIDELDNAINSKSGVEAYQAAMQWLQANFDQDAVNRVVRSAVLKARKPGAGELSEGDGNAGDWILPAGTSSLAKLVCSAARKFPGPILTTNFDPLLSLAIYAEGGQAHRRILDSDGSLGRDAEGDHGSIKVVHLHGYWRDADTLHTPAQLTRDRPKLTNSLKRLLGHKKLIVAAYGGWDDVFTAALADLMNDDEAPLDVLWCFFQDDPKHIKKDNKKLLKKMRGRSRFRAYGGIDCHTIFTEIHSALNTRDSPVEARVDAIVSSGESPRRETEALCPLDNASPISGLPAPTLTAASIGHAVKRSAAEGLGSPANWFANWSGQLWEPPPPPDHRLLHSCFIDTGICNDIKAALRGGQVSGITGFVGMGGVGKTFTALRIAHDLVIEGWKICWVSLLQQTVDDALDVIAERFGLRFVANLCKSEKVAALQVILPLARRDWPQLLIVLDNAEQFPEFHVVLGALPGQIVLVTSRTQEQPDVVDYREIAPLSGELAVEFCTRFLKGKMGARKEWHPTEDDRKDLDSLVKLYGGHPLSLRTVLAGFVRFPLKVRRGPRPFDKVLEILKAKGLEGFQTGEVQAFSSNEPSEWKLRHNLNATFQWLYDDLNAPDVSEVERCAHLLLPVCAVVGTASFTLDGLCNGIHALREYVAKAQKSKDDPDPWTPDIAAIPKPFEEEGDWMAERPAPVPAECAWAALINKLDESRPLVTAALLKLDDISLLQSIPLEGNTYALHPTVREFAFGQEDPSGASRPSSEMLYSMALGLIGESGLTDTLLDLLPRLKDSRRLVEQVVESLQSRWFVMEEHGSWQDLRLRAEAILDLVKGLDLQDSIIWVKCHLGELLDRMGEADGRPMIYDGLRMHLARMKRITFEPPPFDLYDLTAGIELCRHIGFEDKNMAWAAAYLLTSRFSCSSRKDVALFGNHLRTVIDQDSSAHTWNRIPDELAEMLGNRSSRMLDSAFSDRSTSNAFATLGSLFHRWTLYPASRQVTSRAADIAKTAGTYPGDAAEGVEGQEPLRTGRRGITPQHWLHLRIHFAGFRLLTKEMPPGAFTEEMAGLRKFSQEHGIRFFESEMHAWRYRGLLCMTNEDWQQGAQHFGLSLSALGEIAGSGRVSDTYRDELALLQLTCSGLGGNGHTAVVQIENIGRRALHREDDEIRPLFHFALACFHWKHGSPADCHAAAMHSQTAYQERHGLVPLFAIALLERFCGGGAVGAPGESWRLWSMEWENLPKRVISEEDGRTMTLVKPGVQFIESGERRIGMWPFYIDDVALSLEELESVAQSSGIEVITKKRAVTGDMVSSIHGENLDVFLKNIRKDLPTAEECFAAWLQIENGIARDYWSSNEAIDKALLDEVERRLGEHPAKRQDWSKTLGSGWREDKGGKTSRARKARRILPEKCLKLLKEHCKVGWITRKPALRQLYEQKFLANFYASEVMSSTEASRLARLTASSLSLNEDEKRRIYMAAPTLSRSQCDELTKVFVEEQDKFKTLAKKNSADVVKLIKKAQAEFLSLPIAPVLWVTTVALKKLDPWLLHYRQQDKSGRTGWRRGSPNRERCYRLVRPVFKREDMEGLRPFPTPE